MRSWRNESGQVLVLTAVSMSLMLGFMGFATDVGQLFHAKRSLQIGADDAAIAGAMDYKYDTQNGGTFSTSHMNAAATNALTVNGFKNVAVTNTYQSNVTASTLFISSPPVDGPNDARTGFVEAILTVPQNTIFMSLFGFHTVDVSVRAVAGPGPNSTNCMSVYNQGESMYLGGKFSVSAPGCGIMVGSSDSCALSFNGGGQGQSSTLTAGYIDVNGGACGQSADATPPATTYTGLYPADPLQNIVNFPNIAKDCTSSNTVSALLSSTGITITTSNVSSIDIPSDNVICFNSTDAKGKNQPVTITGPAVGSGGTCSSWLTLPSAVYVFEQGVIFGGGCIQSDQSGATGAGVTFDLQGNYQSGNTDYSMTVTTQTNFNVSAPIASFACTDTASCPGGTWGNQEVVIEQPYSNSTGVLNLNQGTSTGTTGAIGTLTGIIYAPSAELSVTDQGSQGDALTLHADLYVGSFSDQASNVTIISLQDDTNSPIKHVTLME